jgi:hypothetical protein
MTSKEEVVAHPIFGEGIVEDTLGWCRTKGKIS